MNSTTPKKNTTKQKSYAVAKKQISKAQKDGFFIEAIAIQETILSDRIQSYLHSKMPHKFNGKKFVSFSQLIDKLDEYSKLGICDLDAALIKRLDKWRVERNKVIHSLCKSAPGTATTPPASYTKSAQDAAKEGDALVKEINNWHSRQKRKDTKK